MPDRPIKRPVLRTKQNPRREPDRGARESVRRPVPPTNRPPSRNYSSRNPSNRTNRGNSNGGRNGGRIPPSQRKPNRRRARRRNRNMLVMLFCVTAACVSVIFAVVGIVGSMAGTDSPTVNAAPGATSIPLIPPPLSTPEPTPDPMEGLAFSPFNGAIISEELARIRPVAVVVNNHSRALPQSGIADADIIYEVLSEGPITRLVTIHHQMETAKVGPVRSVRNYFVDFAVNHGAIFVHHGGSDTGYMRLRSLEINNLDGMRLEGTTFWRDPIRANTPGMGVHSSYTNTERIEEAINRHDFPREHQTNDITIGYNFNQDDTPFEAIARTSGGTFRRVSEITVPFAREYPRRFVYDEETQTYAVYNVHGRHMDEEIGEQVRVTNVLVQYVSMHVIPNDAEGRRDVNTVGAGNGHLFTEGGSVNVRWRRDSHSTPTRWYFMNGTPMTLTPGTTWVNVLQNDVELILVSIEEEEVE